MEIERKLNVFGIGKLQDLVTLLDVLEREKISIDDVRKFIDSLLKNQKRKQADIGKIIEKKRKKWKKNTRRCPTCMMPLMLKSITIPKGKGNLKGYTCYWFCEREDCNFEEYTHENFKEVYQKIMGGR